MTTICIGLDSLLDTRLGTLISMDESSAIEMLKNGYRKRTSDDWTKLYPDADNEAFKDRYGRRGEDGEILTLSKPTNLLPFLNHIIRELMASRLQRPDKEEIRVDVNFYPYQCTSEVTKTVLAAIQYSLGPDVVLSNVYIGLDEFTPHVIKETYDIIFIYDFNEWIEKHESTLVDNKFPQTMVIIPTIYHNLKKGDESKISSMKTSPFAAIEAALIEYMSVRCIDTHYFSVIDL